MNDSTILYGVPKVGYGTYGACTPFPICLKAVSNYLGEDVDYDDAIVACGAAFRLTWDTACWNGGNVDVMFTFEDPLHVYRYGVEALGRTFKLLWREANTTKDDFIAFIREQIDQGIPCIALGIIGPPEACVITGYRNNGQTLLGWNFFQDCPEFGSLSVTFDESGYFISDNWWENRDTIAVMSMSERNAAPATTETLIERAMQVLRGRMAGTYAKGIAAYDAWKKAILDESQFPPDAILSLLVERLMCQGDGMDCLSDGRSNARKYFQKCAAKHPDQPLYAQIAQQFDAAAAGAQKMYRILGGWERNEAQMRALGKPEIRQQLGEQIDICKAADERALSLMEQLIKH